MNDCLEECDVDLAEMQQKPTRDLAHKIKGAMLQLCLPPLANLAKQMEAGFREDENFDVVDSMRLLLDLYATVKIEFADSAPKTTTTNLSIL